MDETKLKSPWGEDYTISVKRMGNWVNIETMSPGGYSYKTIIDCWHARELANAINDAVEEITKDWEKDEFLERNPIPDAR